jgi:predicted peptidase
MARDFRSGALLRLVFCALLASVTGKPSIQAGRLQAFNEHGEDPRTLPYQLFVPLAPTPLDDARGGASRTRPLLVFLHGAGDGPFEEMNRQSLPGLLLRNRTFASTFRFVALFPCSMCASSATGGRGWGSDSFERVDRLIQMLIQTQGVDPARIHLTGQSMGGGGLWRYAAARTKLFAALAPVCAAMRPSAETARALCCEGGPAAGCCPPVWAFHGANDGSVPVGASDEMVRLLRAAGRGQDVRYTRYAAAPPPPMDEYAHMTGHGSYELAYREPTLYAWLAAQRCDACAGPPSPTGSARL